MFFFFNFRHHHFRIGAHRYWQMVNLSVLSVSSTLTILAHELNYANWLMFTLTGVWMYILSFQPVFLECYINVFFPLHAVTLSIALYCLFQCSMAPLGLELISNEYVCVCICVCVVCSWLDQIHSVYPSTDSHSSSPSSIVAASEVCARHYNLDKNLVSRTIITHTLWKSRWSEFRAGRGFLFSCGDNRRTIIICDW